MARRWVGAQAEHILKFAVALALNNKVNGARPLLLAAKETGKASQQQRFSTNLKQ